MDHQFSEDEAREVFARAAERQHAVQAQGEGLSLDELRAIGREAGLDPAHIEAAARAVVLGAPEAGQTGLRILPRGVFRTDFLPAPPTDALWDQIVADARRTFSAQGKVSTGGGVREWRNGNLRVSLEPAADGSRLHLRSHRADRMQGAALLAAVGLVALVTMVGMLISGTTAGEIGSLIGLAAGMLAGALGVTSGQRRWAETRAEQMEGLARRAAEASAPQSTRQSAGARPSEGAGEAARLDLGAVLDADPDVDAAGSGRTRVRE